MSRQFPAVLRLALTFSLLPATACAVTPQTPAAEAPATSAISHEPFYAGIVTRAAQLKAQTDDFTPSLALLAQPDFKTFAQDIRALSDANLQGHLDLKKRGTDSDLKCILKGVSLDLGIKIDALTAAKSDAEVALVLGELSALLSDNIDVIVTPATADSGLDCVIEFGNT